MQMLLVVCDGLGDRCYSELNGLTPLEYARTPNLDRFARKAMCGNMYALGPGIRPSSDVAHMEIFGLNHITDYPGRGPIELAGLPVEYCDDDISFRGDFSTFDSTGKIIDRRAGRTKPSDEILHELRHIVIDNIVFELYSVADHRFALRVHGDNLDSNVSDTDPRRNNTFPQKCVPLIKSESASYTADIVNKYVDYVNEYLREKNEIANGILLRSAGKMPNWYDFHQKYNLSAACICNNAVYNGVGRLLGMDVLHFEHEENYLDYYSFVKKHMSQFINQYDFIFLHLQEGDLLGEDGNIFGKVTAIEHIDQTLEFLNGLPSETVVTITADHSTPCSLKEHSGDAVPIAMYGPNCRSDRVTSFGERECAYGILGVLTGKSVMNLMMNLAGRNPLIGG